VTQCISHGLGAFGNLFPDSNFFDDTSLLGDDGLLGKLLNLDDLFFTGRQICVRGGAVHGPPLDSRAFFAQANAFFDRLFYYARVDANTASEHLSFTYLKILLHDRHGRGLIFVWPGVGGSCIGGSCIGGSFGAGPVAVVVNLDGRVPVQNVFNGLNLILICIHSQQDMALSDGALVTGTVSVLFVSEDGLEPPFNSTLIRCGFGARGLIMRGIFYINVFARNASRLQLCRGSLRIRGAAKSSND